MPNLILRLAPALLLLGLSACVSESASPPANALRSTHTADEGRPSDAHPSGHIDDSHQNGGPRGYLPDPVSAMNFVVNGDENAAKGIWINDDIAYLSGDAGLRIVDVSDPAQPVTLAANVPGTASRDVDFMLHPNGRAYAVLSSGGISLVDVTEPAAATVVSALGASSHNIAVVPYTTVVYNSRSISSHGVGSDGSSGQIDIIDFADPENPVTTVFAFPAVITDPLGVPKKVAATTCHDITFAPERNLAFCAGISETSIWSIEDALQPRIVQVIDWPLVQIHHAAWSARGGDIMILGDEFGGAVAGACTVPQNPYAALWFFDISDLGTPLPLGWFALDYNSVAEGDRSLCTTHFGTVVEDRDLMVMSWYSGGVTLIDFTDPLLPVQVDHYRPEGQMRVWDARYYKGHVYTGDTRRGMDILRIE